MFITPAAAHAARGGACHGVAHMKLSGHEINSQLRQKLEMPTGRHLYIVLGTFDRLERYEKVDFREARSPTGQRLPDAVNVNLSLLDRIKDDELNRLVQTEASRTESVKDRLAKKGSDDRFYKFDLA
jgi:hypothetical protein